jgi:murein endopeptidase
MKRLYANGGLFLVSVGVALALAAAGLTANVALFANDAPTRSTTAAEPPPEGEEQSGESPESMLGEPIRWRRSVPVGRPYAGRLVRGVQLPSEGEDFFTWDPIHRVAPNRGGRRYGTDRLLRVLLRVLREFHAAHPGAPRVGIGDLSRRRGGDFGRRFGLPGHASHQNGLDADVYYPRRDRREQEPTSVADVDRILAQDLVDRFVRVRARFVFVGRSVGLRGNRRIVQAIPRHDDHMHVRLWPP